MYKKKLILTLSLLIFLCTPLSASATTVTVGEQKQADASHTSGEPWTGGGEGEGPPVVPRVPEQLLISPKVTALHSLNALLVNGTGNGENDLGVYFIPSLDDFPVSLKDTVAYLQDYDGVDHRFAVVYDGFFDTEVAYVQAEVDSGDSGTMARLNTSKKVYSSVDNTRTLNLIGYDLLLSDEQIHITSDGDYLEATYEPILVGTSPLTTETVIMDLYKSVGAYEWDIKYAWVKDDDLLLETNPIQSEMGVAISDEVEKGIDTNEGATYVWATRTNPLLYWNRCKKDAIFDGGAHSVTNTLTSSFVGSQVSVSFSKSQSDTVTFGEFCAMARAIMDLYGEPVMTTAEQNIMIQNYGLSLPSCQDKELYDSVVYLAAKGIIDPSEVSYNKRITFADIEPILVRIADPDSRLTFKETNFNTSSELFQKGFVPATTSLSGGNLESIDTVNSTTTTLYNDFFVQCDDSLTNFIFTPSGDTFEDVESIESEDLYQSVLAADSLTCNGILSSSVNNSIEGANGEFDYMFQNMGVEGDFYHFKINQNIGSVTIGYERDVSRSNMELNRESYTLPNANGGVYLVQDGQFTYYSFDEAAGKTYMVGDEIKQLPEYSLSYLDNERRGNSDISNYTDFGFMSTDWTWVVCGFDEKAYNDIGSYRLWGVGLFDLSTLSVGQTMNIVDGSGNKGEIMVKYAKEDTSISNPIHYFVFQVPYDEKTFTSHFTTGKGSTQTESSNAYFSPNNDEVLVSYDYLESKGLVRSYSELGDNKLILTLSKDSTNVILDKSRGIIVVGNTLYRVPSDEELFVSSNGKYYINYRACIGWTVNVLVLNSNGSIMVTQPNLRETKVTLSTASLNTYFPNATAKVGIAKYNNDTYINMASNNPIGNYLVVMSSDGTDTDYVFCWKRRQYSLPGSSSASAYGDDSAARQLFSDKTGLSLSSSSDFVLMYKALARYNDQSTVEGNYTYHVEKVKTSTGIEVYKEYGWWYKPDTSSSYDGEMAEYLSCTSANKLPVVFINKALCNLNINYSALDALSGPLPAGQMPAFYTRSSKQNSKAALDESSQLVRISGPTTYESVGANYDSLATVQILPAPVGMFADVYGLPSSTVSKASSGNTIWYGSQACDVHNGSLVLRTSNFIIDRDGNKVLYALYLGGGKSAIYSCGVEPVGVNVEDVDNSLSLSGVFTDPDYLVDWDAFTFSRLVEKLDSWSTIWLIFVLNILPRIGMTLFFILMILSLVHDFKFVKMFCHNVFDVYKFLSVGRITVDTVNLKRLFLQSIVAMSVFGMLQDGILFEFMMWCAQVFIELAQR